MQKSLIVRIYRKQLQKNQHGVNNVVHGIVENIYTSKIEAFSNKDELWQLVNNEIEAGKT